MKINNNNIVNTNSFKFSMYKSKLLGNNTAHGLNEIISNKAIARPLKCLSNFYRSLKM